MMEGFGIAEFAFGFCLLACALAYCRSYVSKLQTQIDDMKREWEEMKREWEEMKRKTEE